MRTARWEKVKVESGAGGGKDEDAMVVTGRMGRLKGMLSVSSPSIAGHVCADVLHSYKSLK